MIPFDDAVQQFDKYIWALSHRFAAKMRGLDAADLHQEGLIKLYEIYTSPAHSDKTDMEVIKLFKTALVHRFIDIQREQHLHDVVMVTVDLEIISQTFGEDAFADLQLHYCKEYLESFVSEDAKLLLEHLINPTPAVLHMFNIQTMRREHLKKQGIKTLTTRKITHQLVGQVLGFSASKTKALVRELQHACREHLCLAPSFKLNTATC